MPLNPHCPEMKVTAFQTCQSGAWAIRAAGAPPDLPVPPMRAHGIETHVRTDRGRLVGVLVRPGTWEYTQLSPARLALWQCVDGHRTIDEIATALREKSVNIDAAQLKKIIDAWVRRGLLVDPSPQKQVQNKPLSAAAGARRVALACRKLFVWNKSFERIDVAVEVAYRWGGRFLFAPSALAAMAIVAMVGIALFVREGVFALSAVTHDAWTRLLPAVLAMQMIANVAHEAGHALAVKHFGRRVVGGGFGWFWYGPVMFVNTSDMWLDGKAKRIVVSLAGPVADLVVASLCCLVAHGLPLHGSLALWALAALRYATVVHNLCPLVEYDGYYILSDWLDRPNLKPRAFRWLHGALSRAGRTGLSRNEHRLYFWFSLMSVTYLVACGGFEIWALRAYVQPWLDSQFNAVLAFGFTVLYLAIAMAAVVTGIAGELILSGQPAAGFGNARAASV